MRDCGGIAEDGNGPNRIYFGHGTAARLKRNEMLRVDFEVKIAFT
ncbi:hypothetical protein ACFPT7_01460 [Acidicapsa dinghuensis]|uniref:PARP catalytic domain-containing protein n=1 Tax=Acidicapsa dinghuensis TaxID=2218256 RepID=A0ABW1ED95_9BACT|nr:hypothetical protein [Acidicapsa dinghuensis]